MGGYTVRRYSWQSVKDVLAEVLDDPRAPDAGLVDLAIVKFNTAYLAIRKPNGHVVGAVAKLVHAPGELSYKIDSEAEGPNAAECPQRIFKLLTPLDEAYGEGEGKYAREWRARCEANLRSRKAAAKIESGTVIRFNDAISFTDGGEYDTLVVMRERTGRGNRTSLVFYPAVETHWSWEYAPFLRYRLPDYAKYDYDVIARIGPKTVELPEPEIDRLRPPTEAKAIQTSLF